MYDTDLTWQDQGVKVKGVHFELPVTYPFEDIKSSGRAGAKTIVFYDKVLPAVSAKVVQSSGFDVDISGKVTHTRFPGLAINFSARTGLDPAMTPFAKGQIATNRFSVTQNELMPYAPV